MKNERVIIVGGPRRGKSWMSLELGGCPEAKRTRVYDSRTPLRCGDPVSKVKDPIAGVEYLPEGIPISGDDGAAQWVADNWFAMPGPWVCEGWVMARALRRWLAGNAPSARTGLDRFSMPCDRIIVLDRPAFTEELRGQASMHKAVLTVWSGIAHHFAPITEVIR